MFKNINNIGRNRGRITDTLSEDSDIPTHPELEKMLNNINEQYFQNIKQSNTRSIWGHIHDKNRY